jgi:hypothetical protein
LFLGSDVFEWVVITFGILYRRARDVHTKIDIFRQMITKKKELPLLFFVVAFLFGSFMFNAAWNPWHVHKLQDLVAKKYPAAANIESFFPLTWPKVYGECGWA